MRNGLGGPPRTGRVRCVWVLVAVLGVPGLWRASASATLQFGDGRFEISGNAETLNLVREPDAGQFEYIMNRNTARLRIDWKWLERGRFLDKYDLPFIESSSVKLLWRGVYDGFYDIEPGGRQTGQGRFDDLVGGPIAGNRIGSLRPDCNPRTADCLLPGLYSRFDEGIRNGHRFENDIRELFVDLELEDLPVSLRIGRQQVIWGEADQFRLMDIWNPLDVTWRFPVADTFDEFRVPLWMVKGIWNIGHLGNLYNVFLEVVYNPFDFQPGQRVDWLPQPWSLPFPNPLRAGQVQVANLELFPGTMIPVPAVPFFDLQGTSFRRGDFERTPEDASEIGTRLHAITGQGIEWTINYIYGRGKWVGTSPAFGVRTEEVITSTMVDPDLGTFRPLGGASNAAIGLSRQTVRAEIVHPYVHVFGITGNYFEPDYTQAVLRMETAYSLGQPYASSELDKRIDIPIPGTNSTFKAPVGLAKRDVWAGMVGFDRPTWIRWLNKRTTWFLSGQFFWMHIPGNNVDKLHGFNSVRRDPYFTPEAGTALGAFHASDGLGVFQSGPFAGQVERLQDADLPPADNMRKWEFMFTLTATTSYQGGTVVPTFITLFDPVNVWIAPFLDITWAYTNNFLISFQQRVFVNMKTPTHDPWFVGRFGRRAETGLKLTYQF